MHTAIASAPLAITVFVNGRPALRGLMCPDVLDRLGDFIARRWADLAWRGRFAVVVEYDGVSRIIAKS